MPVQRITPFLWFDNQAEEAARFYASIFPNSKLGKIVRCGAAGPGPAGSVLTVEFQLDGLSFIALNGGPHFKFTEAVSFMVKCRDQAEVDKYWNALTANGGQESQCGWLKDKYGLSWQITPAALLAYITDKDPEKAKRTMHAMMTMKKIDIAALEKARAG